jgi:hypothetical protein
MFPIFAITTGNFLRYLVEFQQFPALGSQEAAATIPFGRYKV